MRPIIGAGGESTPARKPSTSGETSTSGLGISSTGLTSFMLTSESELDRRESSQDNTLDSTYGIRSIADEPSGPREDGQEMEVSGILKPNRRLTALRMLDINTSCDASCATRSRDTLPTTVPDTTSQPITPISFASHAFESSVPSSPKSLSMRSFQHSDDDLDGASSNAVVSSEDEGVSEPPAFSEAPSQQLIMPSLIMPTRRPFTERGRNLGNLKILVAGASRVGKTSLVKSMIRCCGDIVHVDAVSLQSLQPSRVGRSRQHFSRTIPTAHVTEIHASTRARPRWWADLEGSEDHQRRRSIDENVLTRNLCFVDTPGFDGKTSLLEGMEPMLKYLESEVKRSIEPKEQANMELLGLLSGDGGSFVDVVLYLIDHDLKAADIEYIRQLNQFSNVIPLLAKADSLDKDAISTLKSAATALLSSSGIVTLSPPSTPANGPSQPFTVCSHPSTELDAMDASVLMQSDFVQPLAHSDLTFLMDLMFEPNNAQYFKHMAAAKALAYRDARRGVAHDVPAYPSRGVIHGSEGTSSSLVNMHLTIRTNLPNYNAEPASSDTRAAQLRLAAWASSLQRSLAHERRRYERLARGEQLAWLRAQLDAYDDLDVPAAFDGAAKPSYNRGAALLPLKRSAAHRTNETVDRDAADPLGIVRLRARARQSTWKIFQIAGGCGFLGAAVIWALHRWPALGAASSPTVPPAPAGAEDWSRGWWALNNDNRLLERLWAWLG